MSPRVQEKELVLPALFVMSEKGTIKTSELIRRLTELLNPTGKDLAVIPGRNDTFFSQKVRNLKSHHTLKKYGYAEEVDEGFKITPSGERFLKRNMALLDYLLNGSFFIDDVLEGFAQSLSDRRKVIVPYSEQISEGERVYGSKSARKRSTKLREAAIDHFTREGIIKCECCGYIFAEHYPADFKSDCIEIHHLKPLYQYPGVSEQITIAEAMKNLIPVCPNCHRVIHKSKIRRDEIKDFSEQVHSFQGIN